MSSPAVSAIIPAYNREELLPRAIHSALAALRPGDEILVVDDGSTDDTAAVAEAFGPPVRLLRVAHGGAGPARNAGFAAARGPLVAFLDSDDEWFPDKIELQRTFLERQPRVLYVCTDFAVRLADGSEHRRYLPQWLRAPHPLARVFGPGAPYSSYAPLPPGREDFEVYVGDMYLEEMRNNFVAAFTFMTRKEEAGEALRFAADMPICEEWPAFGRLAGLGPGAIFDTETAWQHGHSGPRVTDTPTELIASGWLSSLERVWGQDADFLAEHGRAYRRAVAEARLMRASALARQGDPREAARAIRLAVSAPSAFAAFWRGTIAKRETRARPG